MTKQEKHTEAIKRPSFLKYVAEHFKVWNELRLSNKFRRTFKPSTKGDGHPVLVIPGFLGSDLSTGRLRRFLKKIGYTPYAWGLGRNYGDISQLNILLEQIGSLYEKHQKKVSLIGWSLGGVYARQLAKAKPELVRQVITMGSPFSGIDAPNNASWLYNLINYRRPVAEVDQKWLKDISAPAPVPTTAIYSKDDGIVPWQTCMEQTIDATHQNVRIEGSHFGLAHNPEVWVIVEDRLRYDADNWQIYTGKEN